MTTKSGEKLFYEELTYQIRGACFNVWKQFGGAFKESIIDKSLSVELKNRNLEVENQKRIDIYYKEQKVGTYIPDKIVNDKILIELKSKPYITKEDERQFWKYLKGSMYKVGMLINFGTEKLEIKRRIYDRARGKEPFRVDPRDNPRCSASIEKGITLVEIVVVIFITVLFSMILISDFPTIQRRLALSRATYKLAQDLRKTEDFGFSGVTIKYGTGHITVNGYGIYLDLSSTSTTKTKYLIYADVDGAVPGDEIYNGTFFTKLCSEQEKAPTEDCPIEIIDIREENPSLSIKSIENIVGDFPVSINFMPPNPTVNIANAGGTYPAGIVIVLGLATDPFAERKVLVNSSGLIDVVQ